MHQKINASDHHLSLGIDSESCKQLMIPMGIVKIEHHHSSTIHKVKFSDFSFSIFLLLSPYILHIVPFSEFLPIIGAPPPRFKPTTGTVFFFLSYFVVSFKFSIFLSLNWHGFWSFTLISSLNSSLILVLLLCLCLILT